MQYIKRMNNFSSNDISQRYRPFVLPINQIPNFRANDVILSSLEVDYLHVKNSFTGSFYTGPTGPEGNQGSQGNTGSQGPQGPGFVIFGTVNSFNDLCSLNPTNENIGQFALITGGDLFLFAGNGAGNTGPYPCTNSWIYAGDITDETQIIGPTGAQGSLGPQGNQGNIGPQGPLGPQGFIVLIGIQGPTGYTVPIGLR